MKCNKLSSVAGWCHWSTLSYPVLQGGASEVQGCWEFPTVRFIKSHMKWDELRLIAARKAQQPHYVLVMEHHMTQWHPLLCTHPQECPPSQHPENVPHFVTVLCLLELTGKPTIILLQTACLWCSCSASRLGLDCAAKGRSCGRKSPSFFWPYPECPCLHRLSLKEHASTSDCRSGDRELTIKEGEVVT